jgi:4-amino-4-deoxy-L-arabinose transferase-like glycosyltransferase
VTQTDNSSLPPHPAARLAGILLILATFYLCYFHDLGALGLVGPDEPRYTWIARNMAESGDWVTPRLYGQPWFEKPVLYYWGAALSFKLFGVSEAAARYPSALAALLATLTMAWFAWRRYGVEAACWLLLILPTTVGMIGFSHAAATDMPFAAMLTIAMVCAVRLLGLVPNSSTSFTSSIPFTSCLFGFLLGLAVLAKGPAAIVLSGGAVLFWAIFTSRWRDAFRCLHPFAIASFCCTALPWYILCARRNPDFFRIFIIEHNFKRYLTPEFQHIQPFWFYVPVLLIALFPWFVYLVPSIQRGFTIARKNHTAWATFLFFLLWAAFPLLFFSISKSKLPGYILPAVPPLGMLLANTVASFSAEKELAPRWPMLTTGTLFVLLGIALERQAAKFPALFCTGPVCGMTRIWLLAVIGGIVVALPALLRRQVLSFLALVFLTLLLVVEIDRFLPNMDPGISARDATQVVRHAWPDFSPERAATWRLDRAFVYQLNFYLRRDLPEWRPGDPHYHWIFVAKDDVQAARALGLTCVNFVVSPAVIPCREAASVSGLGALGGSSDDLSRSDRQPR